MDRFIWRGGGAAPGSSTCTGSSRPDTGHGGRRTNSGRRRAIDQPPPVDQEPSAFGGSAGRIGAAPAVTVQSDDVLPVPTSSYKGYHVRNVREFDE